MARKPPLRIQPTTLWEYPSQHYGVGQQGSQDYVGATPSYVIWNVLSRYTEPGGLVVDPMCGSGTTLDVASDLGRRALGFDVSPHARRDVIGADARALPLRNASVDLVFMDPPYADNVDYSDHPRCIGTLDAFTPPYYHALDEAVDEAWRVLKPGGVVAVYLCDVFKKGKGFAPLGFRAFSMVEARFTPLDVVAVVRHNKTLEMGNYRKAAEEGNFFLRGFNYLILGRKTVERRAGDRPRRPGRRRRR